MLGPAIGAIMRTAALPLCVATVVAGLGVGAPSTASTARPLPAVAGAGAPLPVPLRVVHAGRWFTDERGRVLVIHGTNMINKLAPYTPDALGFGDEDLQFLADNGFNSIRLGLTWAAVEPTPGHFDDVYIDKIVALAAKAEQYGLIPVVNFHQDGYSEKYGGNGAPDWASIDHGVPGSPLPPPANVLPGAAIANENFWANAAAPDGVGVQDHYAAAWSHVAIRFRSDPRVVFELFNEPSPGYVDLAVCALPIGCQAFDTRKLAPMYRKVLAAVRRLAPRRLVMVEPGAFFGLDARTWLPAMNDPQVGFAFHDYCAAALVPVPLPLEGPCDLLTGITMSNAQAHFRATGEPLLMDELGAGDSNAVVAQLLDRADRQMVGWMHWAYWAQDFGKAATYGLVNDPSRPPVGDNVKQGLLEVLTRPSPRVIAGTPQGWGWDATTATFRASYSTVRADGAGSFPGGSVSEFFLHQRFFPDGYRVQVTGGRVTSPANAPWLTVASLPGATQVTMTVAPAA
jgi:endoglycosylceramidase